MGNESNGCVGKPWNFREPSYESKEEEQNRVERRTMTKRKKVGRDNGLRGSDVEGAWDS